MELSSTPSERAGEVETHTRTKASRETRRDETGRGATGEPAERSQWNLEASESEDDGQRKLAVGSGDGGGGVVAARTPLVALSPIRSLSHAPSRPSARPAGFLGRATHYTTRPARRDRD